MEITRRNFVKNATGAAAILATLSSTSTLISCNQPVKTMSKNTLTVVAFVETSAEKAEALKEVCLGLIDPSRKDKGCISYNLYQDKSNPGKFTFIEQWESQELLDAHLQTPHLAAAGEQFKTILTKELQVIALDKLA